MRILHIGKYYPPRVGGTELYTQQLVRHQSQVADVSVIVSNDAPRTSHEISDNATLVRVARLGVIASMPVSPTLPLHIRRTPADIVHIHMPNPAAALAYLASLHKGELILTHHCDTFGREHLKKISGPVVRAVMRKASRIIVTTKAYLDSSPELAEYYHKCCIIALGIDPAKFSEVPEIEIRSIKEKYGPKIVTCLGRFVPFKGFEFAIRALPQLDATLLLAGQGVLEESLRRLANECGVGDRVHFLGPVPNDKVPALLKASSILLFPSTRRTESFGYSQIEAMAAGIPVINTSIHSGAPEVSLDGVTGFTVPPMDEAALAAAARTLLSDDALRRSFGEAGARRVQENYTLARMTAKTMAVYREAIENRPRLAGALAEHA